MLNRFRYVTFTLILFSLLTMSVDVGYVSSPDESFTATQDEINELANSSKYYERLSRANSKLCKHAFLKGLKRRRREKEQESDIIRKTALVSDGFSDANVLPGTVRLENERETKAQNPESDPLAFNTNQPRVTSSIDQSSMSSSSSVRVDLPTSNSQAIPPPSVDDPVMLSTMAKLREDYDYKPPTPGPITPNGLDGLSNSRLQSPALSGSFSLSGRSNSFRGGFTPIAGPSRVPVSPVPSFNLLDPPTMQSPRPSIPNATPPLSPTGSFGKVVEQFTYDRHVF